MYFVRDDQIRTVVPDPARNRDCIRHTENGVQGWLVNPEVLAADVLRNLGFELRTTGLVLGEIPAVVLEPVRTAPPRETPRPAARRPPLQTAPMEDAEQPEEPSPPVAETPETGLMAAAAGLDFLTGVEGILFHWRPDAPQDERPRIVMGFLPPNLQPVRHEQLMRLNFPLAVPAVIRVHPPHYGTVPHGAMGSGRNASPLVYVVRNVAYIPILFDLTQTEHRTALGDLLTTLVHTHRFARNWRSMTGPTHVPFQVQQTANAPEVVLEPPPPVPEQPDLLRLFAQVRRHRANDPRSALRRQIGDAVQRQGSYIRTEAQLRQTAAVAATATGSVVVAPHVDPVALVAAVGSLPGVARVTVTPDAACQMILITRPIRLAPEYAAFGEGPVRLRIAVGLVQPSVAIEPLGGIERNQVLHLSARLYAAAGTEFVSAITEGAFEQAVALLFEKLVAAEITAPAEMSVDVVTAPVMDAVTTVESIVV